MISTVRYAVAVALLVCVGGAAAAESRAKVGHALLTYYWIIDESSSRYDGRADAVLRDGRGKVLAHTTAKFKRELVREGTGWLRDGRTVMFERRTHGENRFRIVSSRYGYSSTGRPLEPYRTVAVDPHFVKLGSIIYIPQLKGARLPDGTIHDGMFRAADRGHFRGRHVDVFVGVGARGARPFLQRGYPSRSRVTVYLGSGL